MSHFNPLFPYCFTGACFPLVPSRNVLSNKSNQHSWGRASQPQQQHPVPLSSTSSSSSSFSSTCFKHNSRVWAMGGPCIGILLMLGGRMTALIVAFGVMACYCFDLADNAVCVCVELHYVCLSCSMMCLMFFPAQILILRGT